jgi:hypothetical protein
MQFAARRRSRSRVRRFFQVAVFTLLDVEFQNWMPVAAVGALAVLVRFWIRDKPKR